jgi:hypothetical protein
MELITLEFLRRNHACWTNARLLALGPSEGLPLESILRLLIPPRDRIWIATRPEVLNTRLECRWLAGILKRSLARVNESDQRSNAIIPILDRLASGEKISWDKLRVIRENAYAAAVFACDQTELRYAAYSAAAYACAEDIGNPLAAANYSYDACNYAADIDRAEAEQQIEDLLALLAEETTNE